MRTSVWPKMVLKQSYYTGIMWFLFSIITIIIKSTNCVPQAESLKKSVHVTNVVEPRLDELVVRKSYLTTRATPKLFPTGRIKIKCETTQFDLYRSSSEIELVDNAPPKLAQVIGPSLSPRATSERTNNIYFISMKSQKYTNQNFPVEQGPTCDFVNFKLGNR